MWSFVALGVEILHGNSQKAYKGGGEIKSKRPYIKNEIKFAIDHYSCIENHHECPTGVCRRAYDRVMVDLLEPQGEDR